MRSNQLLPTYTLRRCHTLVVQQQHHCDTHTSRVLTTGMQMLCARINTVVQAMLVNSTWQASLTLCCTPQYRTTSLSAHAMHFSLSRMWLLWLRHTTVPATGWVRGFDQIDPRRLVGRAAALDCPLKKVTAVRNSRGTVSTVQHCHRFDVMSSWIRTIHTCSFQVLQLSEAEPVS